MPEPHAVTLWIAGQAVSVAVDKLTGGILTKLRAKAKSAVFGDDVQRALRESARAALQAAGQKYYGRPFPGGSDRDGDWIEHAGQVLGTFAVDDTVSDLVGELFFSGKPADEEVIERFRDALREAGMDLDDDGLTQVARAFVRVLEKVWPRTGALRTIRTEVIQSEHLPTQTAFQAEMAENVAAIRETIAPPAVAPVLTDEEFASALESYRPWVQAANAHIELLAGTATTGASAENPRVPLDRVYLEFSVEAREAVARPEPRTEPLDESDLLRRMGERGGVWVLQGGAGTGKTTFLRHLVWKVTGSGEASPGAASGDTPHDLRGNTPLLLRLRRWETFTREREEQGPHSHGFPRNLIGFLAWSLMDEGAAAGSSAPFGAEDPGRWLTFAGRLLGSERSILLLDALDEVNPEDREELTKAASGFSRSGGRGATQRLCIVTMREAAWVDVAFTPDAGPVHVGRIQPLNEERLHGLVQRWAEALEGEGHLVEGEDAGAFARRAMDAVERLDKTRASSFLQGGAASDGDRLVTTPLLANLAVSLTYMEREGELGGSEAGFLGAGVDLLMEQLYSGSSRDRPFGRAPDTRAEIGRLRDAFAALAGGALDDSEGGTVTTVSEGRLRECCTESGLADDQANAVLEAVARRGLLLQPAGRGRDRSIRLEFPHAAFAEYLAAVQLKREWLETSPEDPEFAKWLERTRTRASQEQWRRSFLLLGDLIEPDEVERFARRIPGVVGLAEDGQPGATLAALEALASCMGRVRVRRAREHGVGGEDWEAAQGALRSALAWYHDADAAHREARFNDADALIRVRSAEALASLGDPRSALTDIDAMEFCWVPEGPFWFGDEQGGNGPQEKHVLYGFWIARFPVTRAQFAAFVRDGGYADKRWWSQAIEVDRWDPERGYRAWIEDWSTAPPWFEGGRIRGCPTWPANDLSWYEACAFAAWLDARWSGELAGGRVRLPDEVEWEKAARGGQQHPSAPEIRTWSELSHSPEPIELVHNAAVKRAYPWGDGGPDRSRANFSDTGVGEPSPPGCFPRGRSPYGAEDLAGNVWEWTVSRYGRGKDDEEPVRVLRGGAFSGLARPLRCSFRYGYRPFVRDGFDGFRVVVSPSSLNSEASDL